MGPMSVILIAGAVGSVLMLQGCGGGDSAKTTAAPVTTTAAAAVVTTTTAAAAVVTTTTAKVSPNCPEQKEGLLPSCFCQADFVSSSKCTAGSSPGACFPKPENSALKQEGWMCWGDEVKTDEKCKQDDYAGACAIHGYVHVFEKEEEVPSCEGQPGFKSQCNPPQTHWGACFTSSTNWLCIGKADADAAAKYMKGDCETEPQQSPGDQKVASSGLCKFSSKPQTMYKCETVPTYTKGQSGDATNDSACFTTKESVTWTWGPQADMNENCITQPINAEDTEDTDTWTGACLLKGATGYEDAEDYKQPTVAVEVV